jgi:hypothetical protein
MKFSERHGYTQARSIAQVESMDDSLATGLWNVTYMRYFESSDNYFYGQGQNLMRVIWARHLHRDLAKIPESAWEAGNALKVIFDDGEWHEVYDLLQAVVEANPEHELVEAYNEVLDTHLAGYRILDGEITPLSGKDELAEVEAALSGSVRFKGARHALRNALTLYSRFEKPDYANSIKESISAVEAVARELTGKATLGAALDQLKRDEPDIHQALISGWKSLYGYSSDEDAIRHGGKNAPEITQDLARYFLVTCSAFVNLLVSVGEGRK